MLNKTRIHKISRNYLPRFHLRYILVNSDSCSLEDLPEAMNGMDEGRERERDNQGNPCCQRDMVVIYIYIYIYIYI